MKVARFNYTAKGGESTTRHIAVITESSEAIQGIDLDKLNKEEADKLTAIQLRYEEDLKPFMKAFRKFKVESITSRIDGKMIKVIDG